MQAPLNKHFKSKGTTDPEMEIQITVKQHVFCKTVCIEDLICCCTIKAHSSRVSERMADGQMKKIFKLDRRIDMSRKKKHKTEKLMSTYCDLGATRQKLITIQ